MSADRGRLGLIGRDLAKSLRAAPIEDRDAAGVALAKRLAVLLDEVAPRSVYAEALRKVGAVVAEHGDDEQQRAFRKVEDALGRHSVVSDLGPKFLAVLTALGLTPAVRDTKGGSGHVGSGKLDELRARASARKHGAAPVDAAPS